MHIYDCLFCPDLFCLSMHQFANNAEIKVIRVWGYTQTYPNK